MGPKKEILKKFGKQFTINDPINTADWKCVVVMAVEKNITDSFVLKYFAEEAVTGRRQNVKVINFDPFVLKILNDFANGELPFKRAFLLNFSSVLHEAAECVSKKVEIPIPLMAKVVKALLLFFREQSYSHIEKKLMGPVDPIKEMSNRPFEVLTSKLRNKEQLDSSKFKKTDKELEVKVRPPSTTKLESHLLKRGEGVKEDQCINDAPIDGYFDLYVLLTGFYSPDLPLELIKAEVPLHGVLCIDTSKSDVRRISSTLARFRKVNCGTNEVQYFWDGFLKILWNPFTGPLFRDTIFQVYIPQKLSCDELKLREFIFREISSLMYDMSDYKRQLHNYLKHIKLRDVTEHRRADVIVKYDLLSERRPNECITVPLILENIIFAVSGKHINSSFGSSTASAISIGSLSIKSTEHEMHKSQSVLAKHGSHVKSPLWSRIVFESKSIHEMKIYSKLRELDLKYQMDESLAFAESLTEKRLCNKESSLDSCTKHRFRVWSANIEEAVKAEETVFNFYWKNFLKISTLNESFVIDMDTCLYPILATRIFCPYEVVPRPSVEAKTFPLKKNSTYELIENLDTEMRKPHFTVTQGSRSVLQSIPFNVKDKSKDFFHPSHLKIVTPEMLKVSSAPEFYDSPTLVTETSFISELTDNKSLNNISFHVFSNLEKFLGDEVFKSVNNFDFVEELNKTKLLQREAELWDEYNCIHYNYSILMDAVFVLLHNRKCEVDVRQETFNEVLKSNVGLRDFFEYILEDESDWLESEEASYKSERNSMSGQFLQSKPPMKFTNSDFWMVDSLKYQEQKNKMVRKEKEIEEEKTKTSSHRESLKVKKKVSIVDKNASSKVMKENEEPPPVITEPQNVHCFEAYDLADTVAQFSGLKTSYHAKNCSLTVDLLERLYGAQDLGVHANLAGHVLHLYSYACPTPHILDPYTCHLCFKNGIIMAFSKRVLEDTDEDFLQSEKGTNKSFLSGGSMSEENRFNTRADGDFFYDMQLSVPSGLIVSVVRNLVRPCYIKQRYLPQSKGGWSNAQNENSRLFLPNGNVVKMFKDSTVEVLKPDTSIIDAYLNDLVNESLEAESLSQYEKLSLVSYLITTPDGYMNHINRGQVVSWKKYQVLQNSDLKSKTTFFRRKDGTNYMLTCDGTIVVQFNDGTKISSSCFVKENEENFSNTSSEGFLVVLDVLPEPGFLLVHMEITVEHPAYATVKYSTETESWDLTLPSESKVTVTAEGCYFVKIDSHTDFEINPETISMNRYLRSGCVQCSVIANLKVFEEPEREKIYVQMIDHSGKTVIVESNSNSYVMKNEKFVDVRPEEDSRETMELGTLGRSSKSVDSTCTTSYASSKIENLSMKLTRKSKYFAVRKDITGYEIIHREDARKKLTKIPPESVVCTIENPSSDHLSAYILISPVNAEKMKKHEWEVESTIPDPKFISCLPYASGSSTYGSPPSWMHPFPKKKKKFKIPEYLTCRIFIETIKSNVVPVSSSINCSYCEMEDEVEVKHSKIGTDPDQFRAYINKLSDDNQSLLREMYALKARETFLEKLKQKPVNTEKLNKYLARSQYCVEMQNFHKHAIRYHIVSNFFQHPAGMAWLLLNEQLENYDLFSENIQKKTCPKHVLQVRSMIPVRNNVQFPVPPSTSKSTSAYSYEELECCLNPVRGYSFSDLSCRSDVSAKTAPAIVAKGAVCTCVVKAARPTKSSPITYHIVEEPKQICSETDVGELVEYKTCGFDKGDLELLEKLKYEEETDKGTMTLEDLMFLGLV